MNDMKTSSCEQVVQFSFDKPISKFRTSGQVGKLTSFASDKDKRHISFSIDKQVKQVSLGGSFSIGNNSNKSISFDKAGRNISFPILNNINKAIKKCFVRNEKKVVCFTKDYKLYRIEKNNILKQYLERYYSPKRTVGMVAVMFLIILTGIVYFSFVPVFYDMVRRRFDVRSVF